MARGQLILNRYRPIAKEVAGGFGTVQVAWDMRIQRKVAIKCIALDEFEAARASRVGPGGAAGAGAGSAAPGETFASESDAAESFLFSTPSEALALEYALDGVAGLGEARTAALLSDANIVAVYDFEVREDTAYLIMEYVDGMPLSQLLREHDDGLTLDGIAAVFSSVAHALEVAHENQVLHLDIKPDNVLINRQGQVKVTDFGLAMLADASGFGAASGGTIGYMPPEQMRQEALDVRCDEWALASLAYEMLAGENPFLAPDLARAEAALEDAELVLPSLCWDELDEQADDVMFNALDLDREQRYDSVAAFACELKPYLGDVDRGHRELAVLVGDAEEADDGEPSEPAAYVPLAERMSRRGLLVASRVVAVAGTALVAFASLASIPQVGGVASPILWALLALLAASAAFKPHLGALLAFFALGASLVANEAFVVGGAVFVVAAAWWFFVGRRGEAQANVAFAQPLAGAVGAGPLAPVMAGCFLSVPHALAAAAFAAFTGVVLAGLGTNSLFGWDVLAFPHVYEVNIQANVVAVLARPYTWCFAASWLAAALAFSACCQRGTRAFDVVGAVAAALVLLAGTCGGAWLALNGLTWQPSRVLPFFAFAAPALISTVVAGAVGIVAAALGVVDRVRREIEESEACEVGEEAGE